MKDNAAERQRAQLSWNTPALQDGRDLRSCRGADGLGLELGVASEDSAGTGPILLAC